MGALMRAHDWSASPLGSPETWPQSLRSVVGLLLQSKFPMFVAWGDDLGFLYNDPYAEILGAKHPQALGSRFHDIWSEIWPDISPLIDAAMAGEATYRENLPLVMNRKGFDEQTWFTFSYSPVRDESGAVAGMYCACTETTKTILAERELAALNETLEQRIEEALAEQRLLAEIVEETDAFVQVADRNYRWLAINRAAANEFERIFGVRPQVGLSMLDVLADQPEHQAAVKHAWSRALDGEAYTAVDEFGDPNRDRCYYEMRYNVLRDAQGECIGAYQFAYDVTDRLRDQERLREAEAALRHAHKMEAIGQLTGGIAHDFNNLLMAISAGLQLLRRDSEPERREPIMDGIRKAVERGAGLTRQLLAFSRRRPLESKPLDLRTQVSAMRDLLDRSLRGDVQVDMVLPDALWIVEADDGELELAVLNLCLNARDALSGGGVITIRAANRPASANHADAVELSVADQGVGMAADVLARAFEPFFTTKDIGKGSGLGLAQVYGFVGQSGGWVDIDSAPGAGTTVTLTFPRSTKQIEAVDAEAAPAPRATANERGHVLLVEDDAEVAALVRDMLRTLGFAVTHAKSAEAALGALKDRRDVDIVFSDVMMAGMSGVELAREIRRRQPELPVVLTTGYIEAAREAEAEGVPVLVKPYHIEALLELMDLRFRRPAA